MLRTSYARWNAMERAFKPTQPKCKPYEVVFAEQGLTTREYFAAKVLAGYAVNGTAGDDLVAASLAKSAVMWADALVVALNARPTA